MINVLSHVSFLNLDKSKIVLKSLPSLPESNSKRVTPPLFPLTKEDKIKNPPLPSFEPNTPLRAKILLTFLTVQETYLENLKV